MPLLLGVVVLILLLWAINAFSKADPKLAARILRHIGGVGALLLAGFFLLRGEIGVAIPVGFVGLGFLGWKSLWSAALGGRTQKSPGQASRVRSAFLEMELDHDTGAMRGRVLAGKYGGMSLDALDPLTLAGL
jgi:nitrogen fixation-related uncharacterized protein